jgi:hypothetical protein
MTAKRETGEYERKPEMPSKRLRPLQPDREQHQESDHNKHNEGGQTGHGPQTHTPAEEKH